MYDLPVEVYEALKDMLSCLPPGPHEALMDALAKQIKDEDALLARRPDFEPLVSPRVRAMYEVIRHDFEYYQETYHAQD